MAADEVLLKTAVPNMDLLPSNIDLSAAEVQLVSEVARESTLQRALKPLLPDYDYIVIDCQPSLGLLTVNALTAAHKVIVPLECEFFALRGVALLTETIEKVQERLNPDLENRRHPRDDVRLPYGAQPRGPRARRRGLRRARLPHGDRADRALPGDHGRR